MRLMIQRVPGGKFATRLYGEMEPGRREPHSKSSVREWMGGRSRSTGQRGKGEWHTHFVLTRRCLGSGHIQLFFHSA